MRSKLEWFDLSKYLKPMSELEWAYHIYLRSTIYNKFKYRNNPLFSMLSEARMADKDIVTYFHEFASGNAVKTLAGHFSKLSKISENPIKVSKVSELLGLIDKIDKANEHCSEPKNDEELFNRVIIGAMKEIYKQREVISISLEHSNEDIIKAVTKYVKALRNKRKTLYVFKKDVKETLQDFHNFRLLALFDLLYWKAIHDNKLTYTEIGSLVWPDEMIDIEQRIRKTGKPLIESVFHKKVAFRIYRYCDATNFSGINC